MRARGLGRLLLATSLVAGVACTSSVGLAGARTLSPGADGPARAVDGRSGSHALPDAVPRVAVFGALRAALLPSGTPAILGEALLTSTAAGREVEAVITVRNGIAGQVHAWRLRSGTCAQSALPGQDVGPLAAFRPLLIANDGMGRVKARLRFPLPVAAPHHVVLLVSEADDRVVACGNLVTATS